MMTLHFHGTNIFIGWWCLLFACRLIPASAEPPLIFTEHIDFVYLRLSHLVAQIPQHISGLRKLLSQELNNSAPYKEAWEEGTNIFEQRKSILVDKNTKANVPDEYHIALITYTIHDTPKDKPFYSVFNTATRNLCSGTQVDEYPFKSFFQFMRLAIQTLNQKLKFSPKESELYRGITIRHAFTVGLHVAFQQFSSLSANRTVSEIYSKNITLMIFKKMAKVGVKLDLHSKFPGESEVLISPFQVFKVTEVAFRNGSGYDMFTLEPVYGKSGFKFFVSKAN